ncbi:MAG: hypothetical protein AAB615_00330 [Patescibacteria group bacterium]
MESKKMENKTGRFGLLFWLNSLPFGIYCILSFLPATFLSIPGIQFGFSLLILFIALPLFGINATSILEKLSKQKFDFLERLSIATILSLLLPPLLLTLEYSLVGNIFTELPLLNTLFIFLFAIILAPFSLENISYKNFLKTNIFFPFLGAFILYATLIFLAVSAYYPLPDSDPYYWLVKLQPEMNSGSLTPIQMHRPLFSSFAYIFQNTAGIDFYAFFKYILPILSILALIPAALVARTLSNRLQQSIVFLIPLSSPSLILYSLSSIPQALINTCIIFFLFFITYAWLVKKDFFYFLSGVTIFLAYSYHEIAAIFFLPWIVVTLFSYHRILLKKISEHWFAGILFVIILFYNLPVLVNLYGFFLNWMKRIIERIVTLDTNFTFPIRFINIDGRAVGWGNWMGVLKYYAFYVGPVIILALIALVAFLAYARSRNTWWRENRNQKEICVLGSLFLLFFAIAELLPRFLNIALLPERAWGFAGITLLIFLITLIKYQPKKTTLFSLLLLVAFLANTGAALYINSLKKYLVTPAQVESTLWIKKHLPEQKVLLSHGHWTILKVYAHTEAVDITNPYFYSDIRIFNEISPVHPKTTNEFEKNHSELITSLSQNIQQLRKADLESNVDSTLAQLDILHEQALQLENAFRSYSATPSLNKKSAYIYYAKPSEQNPYAHRPYFQTEDANGVATLVFDQYPDRFQRVYTLPEDEVVIWEVLKR